MTFVGGKIFNKKKKKKEKFDFSPLPVRSP